MSVLRSFKRKPQGKAKGEDVFNFPLSIFHSNGGVAQLGEHLPCKQGVMGSIPIISTRSAVPTAEIDKASANKAPENVD